MIEKHGPRIILSSHLLSREVLILIWMISRSRSRSRFRSRSRLSRVRLTILPLQITTTVNYLMPSLAPDLELFALFGSRRAFFLSNWAKYINFKHCTLLTSAYFHFIDAFSYLLFNSLPKDN
jgi:hypothetical protein